MSEHLTVRQFRESDGTEDWRVIGEGACAFFATGSLAEGVRLADAISSVAGVGAHHPDLDLRRDGVTVRLITNAEGYHGLTERDLALARAISVVARDVGVVAEPSAVQTVQVTIDALVLPDVTSFWRAVLGYVDRADDSGADLIDPGGRGPQLWFQEMDEHRPQRNRIHIDLWVPHDHAESRIAAALAAGGQLVTDEHAPAWWTLADPEGNEVDVATTESRG